VFVVLAERLVLALKCLGGDLASFFGVEAASPDVETQERDG